MADQKTEVEKVEEMYRKQLEIQERFMAKREEELCISLEREREHYKRELETMRCNFKERQDDLLAQNDGMLAAIGRLHGENATLKKELQDMEMKAKTLNEHLNRAEQMAKIKVQELERELHKTKEEGRRNVDEVIARAHDEFDKAGEEIRRLKKEIEAAGKRKKS